MPNLRCHMVRSCPVGCKMFFVVIPLVVRLGNSGLKVSKIILGTMQYGSKVWQKWVLDEEEAIKHIKIASALVTFVIYILSFSRRQV